MREGTSTIPGLPQAMAVVDLALGGVHAEMAEVPFDWFSAVAAMPKVAPKTVDEPVARAEVMVQMPVVAPLAARTATDVLAAPAVVKAMPAVVEIPGEVWVEGENDGVLLVMQGGRPEGGLLALARAMLGAVGLGSLPMAMVGYSGKVSGEELRGAMAGKAPQQVLVLGQAPLGVLLGRNLGVEGWHAAGGGEIPGWDGGAVGVTYPLELLMKQPLFKRLAWHHLLSWGETPRIQ